MEKALIVFVFCIFLLAISLGHCSEDKSDYYEEEIPEIIKGNKNCTESTHSEPYLIPETNSAEKEQQNLDLAGLDRDILPFDSCFSDIDPSIPIKDNIEYEIPRLTESFPSQILRRDGYSVSYNNRSKCPNWVAWHLSKERVSGRWSRKGLKYAEDLEAELPRQEPVDWKINPDGYDHGHMCPAADNKWSRTAIEQSFLLTNMCPQNRNLNAGDWNELEMLCRSWASSYNDIYIVCGPLFYSGGSHTIGGSKEIWVPDAFYKVVLCLQDIPKAIGFIFPNEGTNHSMSHYVCSIDDIEQIAGIDFFYQLDDKIEDVIESASNLASW